MTSGQVLLGVGLILALAAGPRILASRPKIPTIIILLAAGFAAGAITTDVNPQHLLGRSRTAAAGPGSVSAGTTPAQAPVPSPMIG